MQKEVELKKLPKILVVDDSEFSRKCIIQVLEQEGLQVVGEAESAQRANEVLGILSPNIVIVDVVMPELSGIELARYLKENFKNIYIIMISSLAQEHIIIESISAGASDFMQKPINGKNLISSILKIAELIKDDQSL